MKNEHRHAPVKLAPAEFTCSACQQPLKRTDAGLRCESCASPAPALDHCPRCNSQTSDLYRQPRGSLYSLLCTFCEKETPSPEPEPEEDDAPSSCECSDCPEIVRAEDPYFATPCGTFCGGCMLAHARECGICASEFDLPTGDEEEEGSEQ